MLLPRDRLAEEQYNRGGGRGFGFISMMLGWEELAKEKKGKEREIKNSGCLVVVSVYPFPCSQVSRT